MPVTFDTSGIYDSTSTTGTIALTIASNACLVVGVCIKGVADKSVSAVYVNATDITANRLVRVDATKDDTAAGPTIIEMYGMTAAPAGAATIKYCLVGGAAGVVMVAASYVGAKTANPFAVTYQNSATNVASIAVSISTSTTDIAVIFAGTTVGVTATNATVRQTTTSHFGCMYADTAGSNAAISLGAAVTTLAGIATVYVGMNIAFSAASSAVKNRFTLLGVGH